MHSEYSSAAAFAYKIYAKREGNTQRETKREKQWGMGGGCVSMNENLIWQKTQLNLRAQSKNKASGNNSVYADDAQQDKRNLLAGRQLLLPGLS